MSALLELAERCEAATGPDREINRLIFATVSPGSFESTAEARQYADPSYRGNNADWYYLSTLGLPNYTASLDAALTLVPEGCFWAGGDHAELGAAMTVTNINGSLPQASKAASPALALCAAALRARAAGESA